MEGKSIIKKYKKEELTIVWEPKKCIHAAVCVKELPGVYDPNAKPWIKPENASVDQLKSQIDNCPSGALSYEQIETTNQIKNMNKISQLDKKLADAGWVAPVPLEKSLELTVEWTKAHPEWLWRD